MKGFKAYLPDFVVNFPLWLRYDYRKIQEICTANNWDIHDKIPYLFDQIPIAINFPSIFIVTVLTILLVIGIKESTKVATIMVGVNLFMIISFICFGAFYVKPENWTPFFPSDPTAIIMGTFLIFFAYIGFDAISTAAEETKNPQRDLPIAILGTLVICTALYVCVALVLTGIVPVKNIDTLAPIAHAMRYINQDWAAGALSLGALCALTSVLLIYQLGTTRILFAISRDRFLPKSWRKIHKKFRTPHIMTWVSGLIVIICGLFMDLNISLALANFGTFTSFIIICLIVLILRKIEPNRERPFKVPFCPWFPLAGIVICCVLIGYSFNELKTSSIYFVWWLIVGILIYALYGYHQKRLEERKRLGKNL